jgi:pSer/pThr/pTyr-binding forkhead associated (FHA) protein
MTSNDDAVGEAVEGQSVRYWRVADGTLQFLPGRLVIAAGQDAGHEIRFVRTAGPDGTIVTFGRAEGAPYRHVQLREPTVSRLHARMELDQRGAPGAASRGTTSGQAPRWRLDNLSSTNPVIVNGKPLEAHDAPTASVMLSDGDRIEMGEVAFVFHAR